MSGAVASAPRVARVETFSAHVAPVRYRLPPAWERDLRNAFCDAEAAMGLHSLYIVDAEIAAGCHGPIGAAVKERAIHMFDAEKWCDRTRAERESLWRCREALARLAATRDGRQHAVVLQCVYGDKVPNAPYDMPEWRELAPLAEYTAAVDDARAALVDRRLAAWGQRAKGVAAKHEEERGRRTVTAAARIESVKAERVTLKAKLDALQKSPNVKPEKVEAAMANLARCVRELQSARRTFETCDKPIETVAATRSSIDRETTTGDALREALKAHAEKIESEAPAAAKLRVVAVKAERKAFVALVAKQAAGLLEKASLAYRVARGGA